MGNRDLGQDLPQARQRFQGHQNLSKAEFAISREKGLLCKPY
jgi:hypothetical protein